jgi:hypothetical protein
VHDIQINTLDLGENDLTPDSTFTLVDIIDVLPTLASIDLAFNLYDNRTCMAIAPTLGRCTALTTLTLTGNDVGNKGVVSVLDAIRPLSMFSALHIGGNRIGDTGALRISEHLKTNPPMTELDIRYNKIGLAGLQDVCNALKSNKKLHFLALAGNGFGTKAAVHIAELFSCDGEIIGVDLGDNKFTAQDVLTITEKLKLHPTFLNLRLSDVHFGGKMDSANAALFASMLIPPSSPMLRELFLANDDLDSTFAASLGGALAQNRGLESLSLCRNSIAQDDGFLPDSFVAGLGANKALVKLDLSFCGISSPGIAKLFDGLVGNSTLVEIHLEGNVAEGAAPSIAAALTGNKYGVKVLNISSTMLTDASLVMILDSLSTNTCLLTLSARKNQIALESVDPVIAALQKNEKLSLLDLADNPLVDGVNVADRIVSSTKIHRVFV